MIEQEMKPRWEEYMLYRGDGDFRNFWHQHFEEKARSLLFVLGKGFDPRTVLALEKLVDVKKDLSFDTLVLSFDEGNEEADPPLQEACDKNWGKIQEIVKGKGSLSEKTIIFRDDGREVAAWNSAKVFQTSDAITPYTDIVVDISAMPQTVYFPLIGRLLYFYDQLKAEGKSAPNIHVIVSEDPYLDAHIRSEGIDETASFLHPFEGAFNREATGQYPKIWFPVLGEGQKTQIERIYELVHPDEICPVLPSPSRNPRQGDDIIIEYHKTFFDELSVDPRNIIYCSEFNPFEVYRQVRKSALQYYDVLNLVDGCKVAVSALCNKLMSLGVLLVAYELKKWELGVAQISCQGYQLAPEIPVNSEPVGLWLAGECYE